MSDWVGWLATCVFALSYLFKKPATLRRVQASAAGLWIIYGISTGAAPVVVANVVVAAMAVGSALRQPARDRATENR